jgi:UDP-glucose 4-epimerase
MFTFCRNYNKKAANFIFSSSCTVYGQAETMPITENASIQIAMSPYGNTKQREEIITDTAKVTNINAILLRYFNQLGHIHQLKLGIAIGSSAKLSTVYYANRFWIT